MVWWVRPNTNIGHLLLNYTINLIYWWVKFLILLIQSYKNIEKLMEIKYEFIHQRNFAVFAVLSAGILIHGAKSYPLFITEFTTFTTTINCIINFYTNSALVSTLCII